LFQVKEPLSYRIVALVLRVAKSTPGSTGGEKELIARRKVDKKKPPD